MYYLVWEYEVGKPGQAKFEEVYGRNGEWFKLFEPCDDFLGHELIKNSSGDSYLLIDKWIDKSSYDDFMKSNRMEYDSLNQSTKDLHDSEKLIGTYNTFT